MLSHELRNPLAAIVNSTALIARHGPQSAGAAKWFPVIERRSRHMARLLDDLLDVARITQGKIEVRREPLDLGATVPGVLEEVSLLMNAAKYTPAGGRVWYALAADGPDAAVRVRDTGAGMTADMLARAFEPFAQADETLDRADGGIGVGLTLVRAIVELHGGRVEARSPGPGGGSEFVVRLPLAPAAAPPGPAPAPAPPPPLRVLVVGDDADLRASVRSLLELDGHAVRAVGTGADALAALDGWAPDAAVLDIGLPGMSGYDVARAIRARDAGVRLIALTGYGQPVDRAAAAAAGFDHHLTKPPDPAALDAVLRAAAGGRKAT